MRCVRGAAVAALALGLSAWAPYLTAAAADGDAVDLGGEPVESSTDSAAPTSLDPGLWSVELSPGTQTQYFSYDRRIADSSVHVGVVGALDSAVSDGVSVSTHVPEPDSPEPSGCGDDYESTSSPGLVGAAVIVGDESEGDPCLTAGTITIEVERYSSSNNADLPVAIKIVEEAPVSADRGEPLAETEELGYDVPDRAEPTTDISGASSFDDAPVVDARGGGTTIAAEVTQGTELLWRVSLDWGDQLVVRADLPAVSGEDELLNSTVQLHLVQPNRDVFAIAKSDDYTYGYYAEEPPPRLVAATFPLRYANRDSDLAPTLPGDYWVGVAVEAAPEDQAPVAAPIELTFAVAATDAAAPVYQSAILGQGDVDPPDGYDADTPYLVGDDEFAAVASGSPFTPGDDGDGDAWWGPRRAVGLGVGVASLGCCVAAALWLRARRSATSR